MWDRRSRGAPCCCDSFPCAQVDKTRTQLLCGWRKPAEREYARNQCSDDKIPCALHLLGSCGNRRIRILHARRLSISKPCKRLRNERDCFFDYRRNNAHGFFGVLSLATIKNIVSSLGLDDAWWTNITVAFMICLFLLIQSVVLSRKNSKQ